MAQGPPTPPSEHPGSRSCVRKPVAWRFLWPPSGLRNRCASPPLGRLPDDIRSLGAANSRRTAPAATRPQPVTKRWRPARSRTTAMPLPGCGCRPACARSPGGRVYVQLGSHQCRRESKQAGGQDRNPCRKNGNAPSGVHGDAPGMSVQAACQAAAAIFRHPSAIGRLEADRSENLDGLGTAP